MHSDTKIKAKARIGAVKVHGPNSPDVLSGKYPLGYRETVEFDEPEQVVELDYETAVGLFGEDPAKELFKRDA